MADVSPSAPTSDPTPKSQFFLYEMVDRTSKKLLAEFDSLTGGEQTISMVSYQVIDAYGNVITRLMPGQTTFSPVSLLRAIDAGAKDVYERCMAAMAGKLQRRNYSISMNDSHGKPQVWWHLHNALPVKISGVDFNMASEGDYAKFSIDLQAESIEIVFP